MSITLDPVMESAKDSYETSFCDLYVLHLSSGEIYLTNNDIDINWYIPGTSTPQIYGATPIQRGKLTQTKDDRIDNVDLVISDVGHMFSSAILSSFDLRGTYISIYQIDRHKSIGSPTSYKEVFYGFIDTPSLDESARTFSCSLLQDIPNQTNLRTMGLSCQAWFGDSQECGAAFDKRNGTVNTSSTANTIVHANDSTGENYWLNGVITIGYESRQVKASTAFTITVDIPFFSIPAAGLAYSIQNGCDKSVQDCSRHHNNQNFGGFLAIPLTEYLATT